MNVMDTRATSALLYLDGVHVSFDGFHAINNLSLTLAPGEMRAIIGPNGAGKTTMMDIITGKTKPDDGLILHHEYSHGPDRSAVAVSMKPASRNWELGGNFRSRLYSKATPLKTICCWRSMSIIASRARCSGGKAGTRPSGLNGCWIRFA